MDARGHTGPCPGALALAVAIAVAVAIALAPGVAAGAKHRHGGKAHGDGKGGALPNGEQFLPPKGKIFTGASDTGQTNDYREFHKKSGAHPAVMQSFESWGYVPREALERWADTNTRGMLSLSTSPCWKCPERITPKGIASGKDDAYLLTLAKALMKRKKPTYIRLLPEMNGSWNRYSAYKANGTLRDTAHSTKQFRDAWRRFVLIVRGGEGKEINAQLNKLGMPRIHGHVKKVLPQPNVAFAWVPQSSDSPNIPGNQSKDYFPGYEYVDWVGVDIYGKYPNFAGLDAIYKQYSKRPFLIGEWSPWDRDDPAFVQTLFNWIEHHKRTRMAVYYQGFGEAEDNPFEVTDYPHAQTTLKHILNQSKYAPFAPENEEKKGHGKGGKGSHKHH